ncbi:hypothetical protein [Granulicella arctica]|uniref:hypothetical protein n=1 Tax=Granulicella arctica TaxID=940613 RepID=UPI0021DFD983|nr:hypothetical protein [Granulicella arctica]
MSERSFPFDNRLMPHEAAASRAYGRPVAASGIPTESEPASLLAGLIQGFTQTRAHPQAGWTW